MIAQVDDLAHTHDDKRHKTDEEHDASEETKEMHGLLTKVGEEPKGQQIKVAIEEAVDAKLRLTKLAGLMMHHLLANAVETGVLGQIGNVTVHLTVNLDVLHHFAAISLQAAVEIVQVMDARDLTRRGVEELRGKGLGERVVAFLLVTRYKVVMIFHDHLVETGDLVGRVLQEIGSRSCRESR